MKFSCEEYSSILAEEIFPLLERHHEEIPGVKNVPLDPDFEMYRKCSGAGILRIFTVRVDGTLCGYQVFMIMMHPHSKNSKQANQDILYLAPHMRKGFTGYRFMKWCIEQLKKEGVKVVYQHISSKKDFGRLLERIGFELQDLVYSLEV